MTKREFMRKTGITKIKYVDRWLDQQLIPGAYLDKEKGEWYIPPSARRPYIARIKPGAKANTIRASIVKACLKRQHISAKHILCHQENLKQCLMSLRRWG